MVYSYIAYIVQEKPTEITGGYILERGEKMQQNWLIAIREEKKLSQKNVSEKVGITQPSYCNMEKGKIKPSVPVAKKIADVLGFDWTRFYDESDSA